jgi:hypothetical protein
MPYREGRSFRRAARLYRSHDEERRRVYPALMAVLAIVLAAGLVVVLVPQTRALLSSSSNPADPCAGPTATASATTGPTATASASGAAGGASAPTSDGVSSPIAEPTPAPTASATAPAAPSPSASPTASPVPSASPTASPVPSAPVSPSASATASPTPCPSPSASDSATASPPAANVNCDIIVPANPLTARGLSTPWQLTGPDGQSPEASGCTEANAASLGAFVQATILNLSTGALSVYEPLVITKGTTPAVAPVVPKLPRNHIVTIDVGFNGTDLSQVGATRRAMRQGACVDGFDGSVFGQVSFCNGTAFFQAASRLEASGKLVVPSAGTSPVNGKPCPTTRDFSIVDQDPSDNVTTTYLLTPSGQTAQNNAPNASALAGATEISNGSDNALLDAFVDPALGCKPLTAPDLSADGAMGTSQALDELSAAKSQAAPVALVPENDEMVLVNNEFSVAKTNLYRSNVGQAAISRANNATSSPAEFCQNMVNVQSVFLNDNQAALTPGASPVPAVGNNLFTFMANRLSMSYDNLSCGDYGLKNPVTVTLDDNGSATGANMDTTQQTAKHKARKPPPRHRRTGRRHHQLMNPSGE